MIAIFLAVLIETDADGLRQPEAVTADQLAVRDYGVLLLSVLLRLLDDILSVCIVHLMERVLCIFPQRGHAGIIGGKKDRIVTGQASIEMAEKIPGCRLLMYEGLGHGLYEEAPDFLKVVADFCR